MEYGFYMGRISCLFNDKISLLLDLPRLLFCRFRKAVRRSEGHYSMLGHFLLIAPTKQKRFPGMNADPAPLTLKMS